MPQSNVVIVSTFKGNGSAGQVIDAQVSRLHCVNDRGSAGVHLSPSRYVEWSKRMSACPFLTNVTFCRILPFTRQYLIEKKKNFKPIIKDGLVSLQKEWTLLMRHLECCEDSDAQFTA